MHSLVSFRRRLKGRYRRTVATHLARRPARLRNTGPLISFTFDDFPSSALTVGGALLREHEAQGTYFTSFGLMGTVCPTGEIFRSDEIPPLLEAGHELGCHTFHHYHPYDTPAAIFDHSLERNREALRAYAPEKEFATFSYPLDCPSAAVKRRCARRFRGCRGGGQIFNQGVVDLNYLSAVFIEQEREQPDRMKRLIDNCVKTNGWLIFATHDVCAAPTRFGCTPALFGDIVRYASRSGARIMTMRDALRMAFASANVAPPATTAS